MSLVWPNGTNNEPECTDNYGRRTPIFASGSWTRPYHVGADHVGIGILRSIGNGTVIEAGWSGWAGNQVLIYLGLIDDVKTWVRLCHMAHTPLVRVGDSVTIGQPVGEEGATGQVAGKHLHWEIYRGSVDRGSGANPGATVDPRTFVRARLASSSAGGGEQVITDLDVLMGAVEDVVSGVVNSVLPALRREQRWRKFSDTAGRHAIGRAGSVLALTPNKAAAQKQLEQISVLNPMLMNDEELRGTMPVLDPSMFFSMVDAYDPDGENGVYGRFVKNTMELTNPKTVMVRESPALQVAYPSRQHVWANTKPVHFTYNGVAVKDFLVYNGKQSVELVDGKKIALTAAQIDAANAQRPAGQTW